jgi:hypothetical protein
MTVSTDKDFLFRRMINNYMDFDVYLYILASDLRIQKDVIDSYTLELKDIELDEIENNYNIASGLVG